MIPRRLAAILFATSTACASITGCALEGDDEYEYDEGDGVSEDELVSERQLFGNELPAKTLVLTYDDGPGERTSELAEYLAERGIPATFFINGDKVPGKQRHIDAIINRGHLLANHTHHHRQLTSLSASNVVSDVRRTDDIIAEVQPQGPWLIRAPFGAWNASVARAINASAMQKYVGSVFWDVGGQLTSTSGADWACWGRNGVSVERCGDLYLNEIRRKGRGIVLLHDIHGKTVDMTKYIVPILEREGYEFVQLDAVPSVRRAMGAVAAGQVEADGACSSATLGRVVAENTCVQSRNNQRWFRCVGGEWASASGADDARCAERFAVR
jgi:peptidoglycan/xylan/chitin deacetylase (PgdA/CDA1 family)